MMNSTEKCYPARPNSPRVEMIETGDDAEGVRLDRWIRRRYPGLAQGKIQKILRTGQVRVDGKRARADLRLAAGQCIRMPPMVMAPSNSPAESVTEQDVRVIRRLRLYDDPLFIVLNKPSGLAVQGGSGTRRHIDGMLDGLREEGEERPRLVHRLDRDTSGVLLLARTRKAAALAGELFRNRSIRKIYWALVRGVPQVPQGQISMSLVKGKGPLGELMQVAEADEVGAQHAVTHYSVVGRIGTEWSWLSLKPVTGRTHQLRVHLAAFGHPIVGDKKYGGAVHSSEHIASGPGKGPDTSHLHLHARRITLRHPETGALDVTAPLPEHMRVSWELFGFDPGDGHVDTV